MMVILCNTFDDVKYGFARFMDFLETFEPLSISKVFEYSYCVEIDDLRYIFVDYRMKNIFKDMTPDFLNLEEFFEDLPGYDGGEY